MLEAGEVRHVVLELLHEVGGNIHSRGLGEVIDEERKVGRLGDGPVVVDDTSVAGSHEKGRDGAHGVSARSCRVFRIAGGAHRRLRSHVHDDLRPPLVLVNSGPCDSSVLVVGQEDALTRASCRPEAVDPRLDVVLHNGAEPLLVDLAVGEHRRDDCRYYSLELWHVVLLLNSGRNAHGIVPPEWRRALMQSQSALRNSLRPLNESITDRQLSRRRELFVQYDKVPSTSEASR